MQRRCRSKHNIHVLLAVLMVVAISGCGGGGSGPTAPSPTSPSGSASLAITAVTVSVEATSTGFRYVNDFRLSETGGAVGVTVSSIKVVLANSARTGGATFDRNDKLSAGSSARYTLGVDSANATDPYTQVSFVVTYADDRNTPGTFTSGTTTFTPPPSTNTVEFVSGSMTCRPDTLFSAGDSTRCTGSMTLRWGISGPVGANILVQPLSPAHSWEFRGTLPAAPPTTVTLSLDQRMGADRDSANRWQCPTGPTRVTLGASDYWFSREFNASIPVTCP